MSATMNANLFVSYFGEAPVLEIPGRTFPVKQYFLEDVLEETQFILEENTQYTRKVKGGSELADEFEKQMGLSEAYNESAVPKDSIRDDKLSIVQMLARYKGENQTFLFEWL